MRVSRGSEQLTRTLQLVERCLRCTLFTFTKELDCSRMVSEHSEHRRYLGQHMRRT